ERCGADVIMRVARRDEGYGFHTGQAQELIDRGAKLLVLTDTGTHDVEAVAHAQTEGVDVIAIDHHRVNDLVWPGLALINPQRPDSLFPYKGLCAAGVAFYVLAVLRRRLEASGREAVDPRETLDLVALATLADVAPLDGDNRILVAHGLRVLAGTARPGLAELLRLCEIRDRQPTAEDVGWRLGPRLNAPGRLGDASVALDCLALRDASVAVERARHCDALNNERKEVQEEILEAARVQAKDQADAGFIVVAGEGWHPGVIGIVAGRLSDAYDRPAAVIALDGEMGRGSARSVLGVDVFAVLSGAKDLLVRFGGHTGAAGFSVERGKIDALRETLASASALLLATRPEKTLHVDAELTLDAIDMTLVKKLLLLGPHGEGNRAPIYAARGVRVERADIVGRDHLRLALRQGGTLQKAIGFGMGASRPEVGSAVDIAFAVEIDHYQGLERLQLRLVAIVAA
ncbi:MAG: single-stranded-DNA-specific exonuclease RecJ, partial [Deltaproteobacteria bacterium]|nr:single-stranded-DNA-specific exonuclease RecJ [Deltaproteobacteria bacterium]